MFETLGERHIDGVLFAGVSIQDDLVKVIRRQSYPTVLVTQEAVSDKSMLPTVIHNNTNATIDAVKFLYDNGHRRIAFISGMKNDYSSGYQRLLGYKQALAELWLDFLDSYVE